MSPREGLTGGAEDADAGASERDLVERARARDTEAFRALVDRHRDRAHGLALRMMRSPDDAEEVAQDAFVRAWLALPSFRADSSFATWLHRIVARRALDRLAALRRRRERETGIDDRTMAAIPDPASGAEVRDARARRLEKLVSELPDMQRAVIGLFYDGDASVENVAEALGLPTGTVKTHLSRARLALRRAWTRCEGDTTP